MRLEYSCFISYPQFQHPLVGRMATELGEALSTELEVYGDPPVFLPRDEPGEQWSEVLGRALCGSAAMVLIFSPAFFSERNLHGARELLAMKRLEQERLEHLPQFEGRGLIVPVILRGAATLPPVLRWRQYYDFSDFMPSDDALSAVYAPQIQRIARYVDDCYRALSSLPKEFGGDCENFSLPTAEETLQWLREAPTQPARFPTFERRL